MLLLRLCQLTFVFPCSFFPSVQYAKIRTVWMEHRNVVWVCHTTDCVLCLRFFFLMRIDIPRKFALRFVPKNFRIARLTIEPDTIAFAKVAPKCLCNGRGIESVVGAQQTLHCLGR